MCFSNFAQIWEQFFWPPSSTNCLEEYCCSQFAEEKNLREDLKRLRKLRSGKRDTLIFLIFDTCIFFHIFSVLVQYSIGGNLSYVIGLTNQIKIMESLLNTDMMQKSKILFKTTQYTRLTKHNKINQ